MYYDICNFWDYEINMIYEIHVVDQCFNRVIILTLFLAALYLKCCISLRNSYSSIQMCVGLYVT